MPPRIVIIAALSENRVIGRDGGLPWSLPADLRRFKALTSGHALVMGRRTWASLDGPLPQRTIIVLSSDPDFAPEGVIVARSLDEAIASAPGDPVFIAGGSAVYAAALPIADRLELTVVHADVPGDTCFPAFDDTGWRLVADERHEADARHAYAYSFRTYERAAVLLDGVD